MRCPRPDIIVILAVLVATGVLVTTTAQAQGFGSTATLDLSRSADTTCLLLCSNWKTGWLSRLWHPRSVSVEPVVEDRVAMLDAGITGTRPYHGGGVHYDFMFNRVRAVMMGGDMDVTLRLGNYHHPIPAIDPYLSISLGKRW